LYFLWRMANTDRCGSNYLSRTRCSSAQVCSLLFSFKYVSYPYILYKKRKEKEIKVIPFSTFPMVICTCNELMCVSFTLYTLLVCVCTCMFVYVRIVYCPLFYNTFNLFVQMTCFQGKVTFSISRGKSSETCYSLCYSPMKFI